MGTCLLIFFSKVLEISMDTLRLNFLIRGKKTITFILGVIQVTLWITIVRQVLAADELSIWMIASYSVGYAVGSLMGTIIEEKMAIGTVTIEVIISDDGNKLANILREKGHGVSVIECKGKEGKIHGMLVLVANRKEIKKIKKIIVEYDPNAFITTSEAKSTVNGYFGK